MNVQLQKSVAAVRAGKIEEARALLDELVTADPHNVHALFLLSTLAQSPAEQIALVQRVLEIEPSHAGAQKRLDQLQPAAAQPAAAGSPETTKASPESGVRLSAPGEETTLPVSDKTDDFMAQAEADSLPPWLAGEAEVPTNPFTGSDNIPDFGLLDSSQDLPDWLQEQPAQAWTDQFGVGQKPAPWNTGSPQKSATVSSKPDAPAATRSPMPSTTASTVPSANRMLLGLSVLAVIVAILFAYVLIATFLPN
jgi:hypothetical protein